MRTTAKPAMVGIHSTEGLFIGPRPRQKRDKNRRLVFNLRLIEGQWRKVRVYESLEETIARERRKRNGRI